MSREIRRIKIEKFAEKIMGQACSCESINRRARKIDPDLEHGFCCPKCCWCQWDKALDEWGWNE